MGIGRRLTDLEQLVQSIASRPQRTPLGPGVMTGNKFKSKWITSSMINVGDLEAVAASTGSLNVTGNITVGGTGKIFFGTDAKDSLDNTGLHFQLSGTERQAIDFKPADATYPNVNMTGKAVGGVTPTAWLQTRSVIDSSFSVSTATAAGKWAYTDVYADSDQQIIQFSTKYGANTLAAVYRANVTLATADSSARFSVSFQKGSTVTQRLLLEELSSSSLMTIGTSLLRITNLAGAPASTPTTISNWMQIQVQPGGTGAVTTYAVPLYTIPP
jgi:hypothetical protein